jgi:hypothetical protein
LSTTTLEIAAIHSMDVEGWVLGEYSTVSARKATTTEEIAAKNAELINLGTLLSYKGCYFFYELSIPENLFANTGCSSNGLNAVGCRKIT